MGHLEALVKGCERLMSGGGRAKQCLQTWPVLPSILWPSLLSLNPSDGEFFDGQEP